MNTGRKGNKNRYAYIIGQRMLGKTIYEIADDLGISKQGVYYYLAKYGDIDVWKTKTLDK